MERLTALQYAVKYARVDLDLLDRDLLEDARASMLVRQMRKIRRENRVIFLAFLACLKDRDKMGVTDDDLPVLERISDAGVERYSRLVPEQLLLPKGIDERMSRLASLSECPFSSMEILEAYTAKGKEEDRAEISRLLVRVQRADIRLKLHDYCQRAFQTRRPSLVDLSQNPPLASTPGLSEPTNPRHSASRDPDDPLRS